MHSTKAGCRLISLFSYHFFLSHSAQFARIHFENTGDMPNSDFSLLTIFLGEMSMLKMMDFMFCFFNQHVQPFADIGGHHVHEAET